LWFTKLFAQTDFCVHKQTLADRHTDRAITLPLLRMCTHKSLNHKHSSSYTGHKAGYNQVLSNTSQSSSSMAVDGNVCKRNSVYTISHKFVYKNSNSYLSASL